MAKTISSKSMNRSRSRRDRKGITLILVITIIVLFLLLGTSFVVMSQNYLSTSRTRLTTLKVRGDGGRELIQRALYDFLRGPELTNVNSPLRGQELLADQYGYGLGGRVDGDVIVVESSSSVPGTIESLGMVELTLFENANSPFSILDGGPFALPPATGYFDGMVFSFVGGPAKGISCRIISYYVITTAADITEKRFILAYEWREGSNPFNDGDANGFVDANLDGSQIIISGRPFFGRGAGGLAAGGFGTPALTGQALNPNRSGESRAAFAAGYASSGVNEPWDAPDNQNMYLAATDLVNGHIFASFDRPELYASAPSNQKNFRAFGVPTDGLQFDSDGDGVNDSIWMDIGIPVQTDVSGRYFKPLVAYRIEDLDGRLNINFHGTGYDSDRANGVAYDTARVVNPLATESIFGGATNDTLPVGQGVGPAEISLAPLFDPNFIEYQYLLFGEAVSQYPGRYIGTGDAIPILAGQGRPGYNGIPNNASERLLYNIYTGYPRVLPGDNVREGIVDLSGRFGYAYIDADYDVNGLPLGLPAIDAVSNLTNELVDSPYDLEFGRTKNGIVGIGSTQPDQLYSPEELERLLRAFDKDAAILSDRLRLLAPLTFANLAKRRSVTTDSVEVPVPPEHLMARLFDLVARPLIPGGLTFNDLTPTQKNQIREQVNLMMSPDLMRGLKFDINRPFGDGLDNNGNGVIDEIFHPAPGGSDEDSGTLETVSSGVGGLPTNASVPLDLNNDGAADYVVALAGGPGENNEAYFARQDFARHLYMLILLTTQPDINNDGVVNFTDWFDYNQSGGAADAADVEAYRMDVAQWVANVMDFRDVDVINTPFEFDLNPYNGWDPDGVLGIPAVPPPNPADVRVVWGLERSELLLTEAIVVHDRRTEDRDEDGDDIAGGDTDFDNRLIPVAGAFVEFYNPWVHQNLPNEVYQGGTGVDLNLSSPGGSPVWRMAVVKGENAYIDRNDFGDDRNKIPHSPDPATNLPDNDFERFVYFFDPGAATPTLTAGQIAYFPNFDPGIIEPGQYGVVGSAGNVQVGSRFTTTFGRIVTAIEPVTPASIDMTQGITLDTGTSEVDVRKMDPLTGVLATQTRTNVVVVPLGSSRNSVGPGTRSFAVSDPVAGYPAFGPDGMTAPTTVGDGLAYNEPFDEPVDKQGRIVGNPKSEYQYQAIRGLESTIATFAVVHLQRLANPLDDWDPVTNPYISYDSIGMDLSAFNGVTNDIDATDDMDDTDVALAGAEVQFETLERGDNELTGAPIEQRRLLWPRVLNRLPADLVDPMFAIATQHYFNEPFIDTIGDINFEFSDPAFVTVPYPWYTFNDRPYASHFELANVPWASNATVFSRFNITNVAEDPYANVSDGFGHLPNLFHSSMGGAKSSMDLYNVLDYLEVPSKFGGSVSYMNPIEAQNAVLTTNYVNVPFGATRAAGAYFFNPPFNTISRYRVPAKININTIFSADVWNAVMGRAYAGTFTYAEMDGSRRLAPDVVGPPATFEPLNPYRPAAAYNSMSTPALVPDLAVDCTLFRRDTGLAGPMFDVNSTFVHNHSDRSAFFRNDARQRLANLLTTRSSVFAIWVTVGMFEVNQNGNLVTLGGIDPNNPNEPGEVAIELGSENGGIRRYRGFFIVDRSIPVAFEPGRNHNVDRMILTESFME